MSYSKLVVSCGACSKELCVVEASPNQVLTDQQVQMYKDGISCDVDGQADIQAQTQPV